MVNYTPLNSKAKKLFYEKVRTYFKTPDDFKFDDLLFVNTKNKYFLMDNKYAEYIDGEFNIKVLGVYIAEINDFGEIRLSIEGSQLIGPVATEHMIELNSEQVELFVRGNDLDFEETIKEKNLNNQHYIIYYTDEFKTKNFLGCAKVKNGTLFNYTSKNRRVRD